MKMALVVAVLVLGGCSSSSSSGDGPCAIRKGTYTLNFKTRGGDCGDLSESVFAVDQPSDAPGKTIPADAPCTGQVVNSADNCIAELEQTCPTSDGGQTKTAGKVTFSDDGASGGGIVGITLYAPNGDLVCNGTYDATYIRQ